jgi:hypothetical protein
VRSPVAASSCGMLHDQDYDRAPGTPGALSG